jgi:hypothetical protein
VREQLSRLARAQARAIGIVGTDVYDRIYLAQLVREHLPDAQLFIVGRDVLYLHPAVAPELVGTWVVTADADDEHSSFVAAGFHDAVQRQVCELSGGFDCSRFAKEVRLLAVGRKHFHPLRFVAPHDPDIVRFQTGISTPGGSPDVSAPVPRGQGRYVAGATAAGLLLVGVLGLLDRRAAWNVGPIWEAKETLVRWVGRSPALDRLARNGSWRDRALGTFACWIPAVHLVLALALAGRQPWSWGAPVALAIGAVSALAAAVLFTLGSRRAFSKFSTWQVTALVANALASAVVVLLASDADAGERVLSLSSGLSPLIPLGLTGLALCMLLFERARREAIRTSFQNVAAWAISSPWQGEVTRVRCHLGVGPSGTPSALRIVLSLAVPVGLLLWSGSLTTMEARYFDVAIAGSLLVLAGLITNAWLLIFQLWYSLRPLLRALAAGPFRDGFDAVPKELSRTLGLRIYMRPLDVNQLAPHVRLLNGLAERGLPVTQQAQGAAAALALRQAGTQADLPGFLSDVSLHMSTAAGAIVSALPNASLLDRALAERYVAFEVTRFISVVFLAIRSLAIAATCGVVLFFLAISSYPFRPSQPLLWGALLGFAAGVTVILTVLFQSNRNELLSRITESTPNRVNFDREFLLPLLTYAVVPLLVILSRFPGLDRAVQSILPWVR